MTVFISKKLGQVDVGEGITLKTMLIEEFWMSNNQNDFFEGFQISNLLNDFFLKVSEVKPSKQFFSRRFSFYYVPLK